MTAIEELRALLDERGAEHEGGGLSLRWRDRYGIMMQAFPLADGELGMGVWSCTPEQAIAATLGVTDATAARQGDAGTCEYCRDGSFDGQTVMMSNHGWQRINFCPNCGAKVIDPTANDVDAEVDE